MKLLSKVLKTIEEDESLIIQSGKPIGILKTHPDAPLVIMANSNLVGKWATSENFYDLYDKNLIAWGGLTAGDWQYIGSQGVIQGTYEIFKSISRLYFSDDLSGRLILTAGMGGKGVVLNLWQLKWRVQILLLSMLMKTILISVYQLVMLIKRLIV